jgi:hypothetical protein
LNLVFRWLKIAYGAMETTLEMLSRLLIGGGGPEMIDGEEDKIPSPEILSAPFVITHNKGSVS